MAAIDLTLVQELLDLCDEEDLALFRELIGIFLGDAPARIAEVLDGCARGDFDLVERAAHALKGSAGNLGAIQVQALADQLQGAGRAADLAEVRSTAPALEQAFAEAAAELRAWVDGIGR
jgi:HPt (histidine-containing phosphotransfer) domain-containing protein